MGFATLLISSASPIEPAAGWLNSLEPPQLVESFLEYPPEGFAPLGKDTLGSTTPGFVTAFNTLTTLDDSARWLATLSDRLPLLKRILTQRTVFAGTTVSEYAIYPHMGDFTPWLQRLAGATREQQAHLLIIKDIPLQSPLLSDLENQAAGRLLIACRQLGFQIVSGQALAYVPLDFRSGQEYLDRLSYRRRKDLRRKLKAARRITVERLPTGHRAFEDESFLAQLFQLYIKVYDQSNLHFDRLTYTFFASVFRDAAAPGVVFVYRHSGKMIGWNLCYEYRSNLVDKYIGLAYPDARQHNLYFVSWFQNLEYAVERGLNFYIAGWTDPQVKASLGAKFTFTQHAVYASNPLLRFLLLILRPWLESDRNWVDNQSSTLLDVFPPRRLTSSTRRSSK